MSINPRTLAEEIRRAGVSGIRHHIIIETGECIFGDGVSDEDKARVLAVLEAHDPDRVDPQMEIERIEREGPPIPRRFFRDMILWAVTNGMMPADAPSAVSALAEEDAIDALRKRK